MVQIALLPSNLGQLLQVLGIHPCSVLTMTRMWRADDLDHTVAPDLTPFVLRQVVKRLAADWSERKCTNLQARPRLLLTHAEPGVGHEGPRICRPARWRWELDVVGSSPSAGLWTRA